MRFFKYIFLTLLSLIALVSFSQQSIGSFPSINGGFESVATGALTVSSSIANATTSSSWTKDNASLTATINSTSPRTGTRYLTCQNTTATAYRLQSPTVNTSGSIANTTAYTVQYYYKTANATAVTNFQRAVSPDGTGAPGTYGATTMAGTSGTWTKIQVSQTSGSSASATKYGIGILRLNGASAVSVDIDDYVIYAGAADNTAPSAATSPTITASSCTSLNVSWAAASGGVDGGGYMVVRGTTDPTTAPNVQGIYNLNGTIGSGTVVYIGTGRSFTDNSLTTNTTYYYRIYTVDKAFNYSSALTGNGFTSSPSITTNPSNVTINSGSNTSFSTAATNSPSSYTWQVSTDGGSSWSNVSNGGVYSGATTSVLTLTAANYTMNGYQYRVTATNGCGTSTNSTSATLTVNATIPVTGSNSYTMCSGILYDDGGTGNYSTYVSGYSVIYPATSGAMVRVSGTLNVENGYDYVTIYDGVGTSGTVLYGGSALGSGTSCGNYTIPTITSTSGPLTVSFTSDVSGVCTGMVLNVSCFTPAYQAQITSINTGSSSWCSGEVRQVTVTVKNTGTATWTNSSPDINVGVKWNADADYSYRTDVGGLAPGQTQTYSINVTAPSNATTSNLAFDLVYEGCFWFASNPGSSCGTTCQGNSVYTSPSITVNAVPSVVTITAPSTTICNGSSVSLTASGGTTSGAYISGGLTTINGLTGAPAPLSNYFGGDKTQMLFTAAELTSLGYVSGDRITSLGFAISTVGTTTSLTNFQIDYKFVSGATTTLTSTFQTGLTTVKTSFTWSLPTTGLPIWSFVTFDTPITWDGTSSLVLQTCYSNSNTGNSSSSVQTYLSAIGANRCVYYRADGTSFATILANATGTTSGNRPDVRLGWTKNAIWSWSPNTSTSNVVSVSPTSTTNYIATSTSSAGCTSSGNLSINVSPTSVAGTASSNQTICSGTQPSNITLTGNTGTIQWQVSSDGTNFSDISGATSSPLTSAQMGTLTTTRYYRAVVTSGVCSSINSNTITITVSPTSVAGTTSSNQTICSGTQPSNVTLTGNVGNIQWQVSTDGTIFTNIVGATSSPLTSAQMGTISSNRWYRAVVTSGVCSSVNSGTVSVTVNPTSVAGTASSDQTICYGSQPVALGLSGNTGTIQWQVSTDNVSFSNISGATSSPLTPTQMGSLTSNRYYRAVVTSGVCSSINSNTITINVSPTTVAGTASSNQTICSGGQPSNINLTGNTGNIQWQVSSDNITFANVVGATSSTLSSAQMGSLTSVKYYRAVVTSGVCSSINSNTITITVNSLPSITASGGGTVCFNSSQTLSSSVSGGTGTPSYQWQSCSTSNGTYSNITGATSSTYNAPTNTIGTTYYKVSVTYSGNGCGTSISNTVSVTIPSSLTTGTHNSSALTICQGGNPASMTISAPTGGISPYTYQWQSNNSSIIGETSTTYNSAAMNSVGTFSINCVTTDACGTQVSSTPKIITVVADPSISVTGGGTVCVNSSQTLTGTASGGTGTLSYQWESSPNGTTWTSITGATGLTYNPSTTASGTTYYHLLYSATGSGCTSATSNSVLVNVPATLTTGTLSSTSSITACEGFNPNINLTIAAPTGGISPFTYQWQLNNSSITGQTTTSYSPSILNTAGVYSYNCVTTDACGNSVTSSSKVYTIVADPTITSQPVSSSTVCLNGSITLSITATGGTPSLTYQWYSNTTASTTGGTLITGATSTTYNASTTTAGIFYYYCRVSASGSGCSTATSTLSTITVTTLPASTITSTNVSCNGGSNGSINLSVSGGTTPYSYLWSNSATTQNLSNLSAGSYSVTITDVNGCQSTNSVTITQPSSLTSSIIKTDINCYGGSNGSINLSVSGGITPYTYIWSNGATTQNLSNLSAGVYSVTVTDANGCQLTNSAQIIQPSTLSLSSTSTNVNCNGGSNGSIDLTVSGGTTPYTYLWSNSSTTQDLSNLSAGSYSVTVTDNKSCQSTLSVSITQPIQLTSTLTQSNALCNGQSNGSINLTPSGGTTPYTYLWSNGVTTEDLTGLSIGNYSVTITDSKGCQTTNSATITQPTALSLSSSSTNVSCNGGSNGAIDLSVSGGTSSYTYLWSNSATTQDLTNIVSGSYSVTVTDANGCQSTRTVTITQPTQLTSSLTKVNVLCFGNSTGSINLTTSGGTSPYTYSWSNGATTEDISLLSSGNYSVTITDANGCATTNSTTITQPSSALSSSYTSINVSCNSGNNGSIDLTVSGGTSPYTYSWSNSQTTQDLSNLTSGTYSVVVTDANSCQTTRTITITQPTQLSSILTKVNVNCFGTSTGSIDVTPTGGTLPYTYLWSNGSITEDLTNISSGGYTITITDANGCTTTNSTTITQPTQLSLSSTSTNVLCFGNSTGSIDLTVNGGTSPYTYSWSSGQTTQDLTNIAASNYSVIVTDANGCQTTTSVTITDPTQLTSTFTQVNVSCNGGNNGSIDLSVSGGTSSYTYNWSNAQTTEDLTGLTSGNYTVTITDANGCQTTNSVTITQPLVLSSTHTQFNPSCFGTANGSINLTPTGGTSPYTYLWNNGQTTEDLNSLVAGTYSVTITDSKGCQATRTVTITQPTQLTSTVTTTNINCYGQNTGSASVSASGGTPPYLYMWNTGNTQSSISNLSAGNYQITVTDNKGCSKLTYVTITQPSELSISLNITSYPNCGSSNGSVSGSVIGGTPPYTYSWSNGTTSQNLTNVVSGNYTLTVTDSKGCQSQSSMTLGCTSSAINVGQIDGLTSICGTNSTSYTINYSNASPQSINWILPNGITSNNGLSNPTINVNFSSGFVQDSIKVNVISNNVTYHRAIWVTKLPNKPIVSGSFCGEPTGSIKSYIVTNSQPNVTYNWVPPYGVNVYSGQGNDTVQFKASIMLVSGSGGSVTATNACGSSTKTFTLDRYVVRPTSILGPTTVCADGNTIYTYRVDSVPTSFMYMWTVPNGVSIIGSSSNDTLKVKFSTNFTSGQFSVMSVNQCGSSPMTYGTVSNNNIYTNIGTITGPGDLCPYLGQSVTYSVTNQSGTFTWSVPTNMTIQTGQGTNSITVLVSNSFSSGTISVNLNNGCGGSISSSKTLSTTTSTISASSISGVRSVCSLIGTNTSTTFSVNPISGVNYVWSVPENSTIVSGQGTNSINVTFQTGFTGGNIQVVITGGCGNPITRTRLVDLGLPSVSISGVNCVDNGYTNTYSVSTTGALSFNWTVPGNAQIVRGQGTNSIDVFFPGNFESTSCINNSCDSIRLTTQFGCGNVLSKKKIGLLTVRPTVTGTSSVCFPDTIRLTASTSPRNTSYIWSNSNGTQFIGSTTGNSVMAKTSSSFIGGTFSVMGVNTCGSSPMGYFGVNKVCPVVTAFVENGNSQENVSKIESGDESDYVEISKTPIDFITFPNPGKDKVNLRVFKGNSEYYLVQIYNLVGQKVYSGLHESEDILDLSKLEEGVFFITIEGKEGWKLTKELVISR